MSSQCKAKNKATCRYHGVGLRQAKNVIQEKIDSGQVTQQEAFKAFALLKSAEEYDETATAKGAVVYYDDGSSEIFLGEATDPYRSTDWTLTSASGAVKGFDYSDEGFPEESDPADMGLKTIASAQKYYNGAMLDSRIIYAEGEDTFVSDKKVTKITVL